MCGRYTQTKSVNQLIERFQVQQIGFEFGPRYNIAPSQPVATVTEQPGYGRVLDAFRWGLIPSWAKDESIGYKMINARAETLPEKPSFKIALLRRRCLIPADGFYEWMKEGEGKNARKQPMRIHLKSNEVFSFAGLWDEWTSPDGSPVRTCTVITTAPNELMSRIHNRMPAILRPEDEAAWLDVAGNDRDDVPHLLQMLQPYPDSELAAHAVSTSVNSPAFDAEGCIEPVEAE
ncbi:MAG TPA: SOS response-associated peptidase [Abditibacteriaceae bacterium]|jgi:putative SOS response-associated peptidase YedK